ncbi:MAG: fibronectin type III domain-containing protein, partial [Thermoguttaceae bacterium]|nr:fibronectin type III domain-containing protein [Thermoguttaceae bacterium]
GGAGGAVYAYQTTLTISNSTFQNNIGTYGGAIYSSYSAATISNTNFQSNTASGLGGGAIGAQVSTLIVSNANFQNNTAAYGGAFDLSSSTLILSNSTLTRNTALNASALYLTSANVRVFNATIYGNSASNSASNRTIFVSANSHLDLHNTIVAGNSGADVYKADVRSVVSAYNVLSSYKGWTNADAVVFTYDSSKPLFTGAAQDDYTLAPGSQAINMGDDVYVYAEKDLAGNARVSFDAVDLGAYEYGNQLEAPKIKSSSSTHNTITVSWNAIANATGYVVAYKSPTDSAYIEAPATTSTTFTINNLAPETEYKVKVLAKGDGTDYSDSLYGSVKTVVTKVAPVDPTPLTVPTWKTSSSTYNSVTVAWNPVANASGYVVEYKSSTDTSYTIAPTTTATAITIPSLAPETTYKLRVYAVGNGVNYSDSDYSAIKAVKTKVAPVDPTPLTVPTWKTSSSTHNSVTVAWNPVANASGYVVEYKGPTDTNYTVMSQTNATSATVPNLAPETTYKLRVYAAGDGVNYSDSGYSTIKAVKTKIAPDPVTPLDAPTWKSSS